MNEGRSGSREDNGGTPKTSISIESSPHESNVPGERRERVKLSSSRHCILRGVLGYLPARIQHHPNKVIRHINACVLCMHMRTQRSVCLSVCLSNCLSIYLNACVYAHVSARTAPAAGRRARSSEGGCRTPSRNTPPDRLLANQSFTSNQTRGHG